MTATGSVDMRASSMKDCPRKAVAESIGVEHRPFSEREQRWMYRGKVAEDAYAQWLQAQHPDWTIHRQVEIPWEHGTGHADLYAVEPSILFEILNSDRPAAAQVDAKIRQLVTYMLHHEAESGMVVILDHDMNEDRIPVARTSQVFEDHAAIVRDRIRQVTRWREERELPDRVCAKPQDAIGRFCRCADWCFEGWEPPPLHLIDDADARTVAVSYWQAKSAEQAIRANLAEAETHRKAIEAELASIVPEGQHQVGGLKVTRTHVERRPTIDTRKVEAAGLPIPDEFWKPGAEYDTWRVERLDGEPLTDTGDYGEVPF